MDDADKRIEELKSGGNMKVTHGNLLNVGCSIPTGQHADSHDEAQGVESHAIDHFSKLPLDMHRKILGHATSKSINKLKAVSRLFRARAEDPVVQAACLARFAHRFEPLRKWEPLLRASVNAPHELMPSDALLATRNNSLRILNPANIAIVPSGPNWYTNARTAMLMHRNQPVGHVQLQPSKRGDAKRIIALNDHNDQLVGFGHVGNVWTHFAIQTFTATPLGLVKAPQLLKDVKEQKLRIGHEYFVVFKSHSHEAKPTALMVVPPEFELCRLRFAERVAESGDDNSFSEDSSIDEG